MGDDLYSRSIAGFRGWMGESAAAFGMWLFLNKKTYTRFHNVIVPSDDGTTQIDHILVSRYGIFVVETKNMSGWIFGNRDQSQWTQVFYNAKYRFQNPLRQNYRHTQCLSKFLGLEPSCFHSVVVFIGECSLKTEMPDNVLTSGICTYIKQFKTLVLSENEMTLAANAIQQLKIEREYSKKAHIESLQMRHSKIMPCPNCGGNLVERFARKGTKAGRRFMGCSRFPHCRYTKDLPPDLPIEQN